MKWRLLLTGFNDPYTNMAMDEAILREYLDGNALPTLRIYGWKPEGFSLGYFHDAFKVLNIGKCLRQNVHFVRRITGGGIIFHNHELTYSISCSKKEIKTSGFVKESFRKITLVIINAYKSLGLNAHFCCEYENRPFKRNPASVCFAGSEDYDVIIDSRKIGGNAQRRIKNIIFQHGSIPLKLDFDIIRPFLNEQLTDMDKKVISLEEALGRNINFNEVSFSLIESFKKSISADLIESKFTAREEALIQTLKTCKYKNKEWNIYRKYKILYPEDSAKR